MILTVDLITDKKSDLFKQPKQACTDCIVIVTKIIITGDL